MNHGNQLSQSMQPELNHWTVVIYLCIFVVEANYPTQQQVLQHMTYSKNYTPCHVIILKKTPEGIKLSILFLEGPCKQSKGQSLSHWKQARKKIVQKDK